MNIATTLSATFIHNRPRQLVWTKSEPFQVDSKFTRLHNASLQANDLNVSINGQDPLAELIQCVFNSSDGLSVHIIDIL